MSAADTGITSPGQPVPSRAGSPLPMPRARHVLSLVQTMRALGDRRGGGWGLFLATSLVADGVAAAPDESVGRLDNIRRAVQELLLSDRARIQPSGTRSTAASRSACILDQHVVVPAHGARRNRQLVQVGRREPGERRGGIHACSGPAQFRMEGETLVACNTISTDPLLRALAGTEAPRRELVALVKIRDRAPGHPTAATIDEERIAPSVDAGPANQEIRTFTFIQDITTTEHLKGVVAGTSLQKYVWRVGRHSDTMGVRDDELLLEIIDWATSLRPTMRKVVLTSPMRAGSSAAMAGVAIRTEQRTSMRIGGG